MAHAIETERARLLVQLEKLLEIPMIVLSFVFLLLVVIELTDGVTAAGEIAAKAIWIAFGVEFAVKFAVAPGKRRFLTRNWLTIISLLLPAFRVLRIGRALRSVRLLRGLRFARLLGSLNRGMHALRRSMRRYGFGYVVVLSLIVLFAGAAGMMAFEREGSNRAAFETYSSSLWWTAMLMTSLGSEYWPRTGAGRALTLILSLYAFAVFGYITAMLASFLVGKDQEERRRS